MVLSLIILTSFGLFLGKEFLNSNDGNTSIRLLMNSSLLSALILLFWFIAGTPSFVINFNWFYWGLQSFTLSIIIDFPFVMFSAVGLFVTWSIIEFSHYYMENDPSKNTFISTLILFLLFMLLLVTSNSLFLLFIGWEGVGIMSFILIGWWFTRADANSSALQAIIYNRIGDSGMILFMIIMISSNNSWNLNEIIFLSEDSPIINIAILGIILAAVGKSAQFSLHPWLPAAMEGPTPVSALLHSSTMVVAGVFLLFRCSPLINSFPWALTLISLIGSITALYAASVALTQYDIKKIVAYSTTSQLGLMVVALGIGAPNLALFHICTHAFFKALLFLCSGSIIHSFNNEQDIRKMGNASASLPLTTSCIIIASLALCGLPFLAGYYSKDIILEASQINISNSVSVILALLATMMTAIYSTRMIFFVSFPNINSAPVNPLSEENNNLSSPIIRLASGVFLSGWVITIVFINNETFVIPWSNKILPLLMLIFVIVLMFNKLNVIPVSENDLQKPTNFLSISWFFVNIIHSNSIPALLLSSILGVLRTLDQGWTTLIGAVGISNTITSATNLFLKAHSSILSSYFKFLLLLSVATLFLIILL
uniref:NADH-ubiquinone oxidoreductase chain 5 n=1 Tax=Ophiura sarsii TaxID=861515 RepID=A0A5J6BS60_9ECHI|nr:NADH dehydrogenase subunit 5 [Ophiura sarsii]QEP94706.1 NADH dehydrogenase subunit 5 [Ophiura sarsii]QHT54203.1 NADH dehydrogenase subunit 5 [Ophiura sarsii]QYF07889.1 NADH dehydrogenase subunit 5 [Ophiura sarsii]